MRHHLMWHLSLVDLESGVDVGQISQLYERELDPKVNDPTPLETLCDNASFLWRCYLAGHTIPASISEDLLEYAAANFGHRGFSFADMHYAMSTALHPNKNHHSALVEQLAQVFEKPATRVAHCVHQYAEAFGAFVEQQYDAVVAILEPVVMDSVLLGGSNPQRRIVKETYLEACIRSGQFSKARTVLQGRNRVTSTFDRNLFARINEADENRPDKNE